MSRIDRAKWRAFWAIGRRPNMRLCACIDGAYAWTPDKAHLIGEALPVERLDAYLGVTASFRVPARRKAQADPDPDPDPAYAIYRAWGRVSWRLFQAAYPIAYLNRIRRNRAALGRPFQHSHRREKTYECNSEPENA